MWIKTQVDAVSETAQRVKEQCKCKTCDEEEWDAESHYSAQWVLGYSSVLVAKEPLLHRLLGGDASLAC